MTQSIGKKQEKRKEHKTMSEFENLKVGDKVIVSHTIWGKIIRNVARTTNKQIVIGDRRYWKESGKEAGGSSRLFIATEDRMKEIEDIKMARELCSFLNMTHWENLSLESLTTIVDCVKKEIGNSAAKQ